MTSAEYTSINSSEGTIYKKTLLIMTEKLKHENLSQKFKLSKSVVKTKEQVSFVFLRRECGTKSGATVRVTY